MRGDQEGLGMGGREFRILLGGGDVTELTPEGEELEI